MNGQQLFKITSAWRLSIFSTKVAGQKKAIYAGHALERGHSEHQGNEHIALCLYSAVGCVYVSKNMCEANCFQQKENDIDIELYVNMHNKADIDIELYVNMHNKAAWRCFVVIQEL